MPYSLEEHDDDDDDEDEDEYRRPRLVFEKLLQIQLSDARERAVARTPPGCSNGNAAHFFCRADCSAFKRDVLRSISVSTSMVHRPPRHAVLSTRIITSPGTVKASSTMARAAATPRIKQRRHPAPRRRQAVLASIGANHSCINVTVTMISHRNVSRAIRPSDLNCKY